MIQYSEAIFELYPSVVEVSAEFGIKDADGNQVSVDEAAVAARQAEITQAQLAAEIRAERNKRLAASDWTQFSDAQNGIDMVAWTDYRQALRDVPQQAGFPETVTWPTAPTETA